jgi:hypothetical protein
MVQSTQGNLFMKNLIPMAFYERKYQIAPSGEIWNLGRECWKKTSINPNGYVKVTLSLNGEKKQNLLHQLVARHFLPNPYGYIQVNHKNGVKTDNFVENLEWISASGNIQHSLENDLRKGYMSLEEKRAFVKEVLEGALIRDIANRIGRKEESLSGMLRRNAEEDGLLGAWQIEMKRRRAITACQNIGAFNDNNK